MLIDFHTHIRCSQFPSLYVFDPSQESLPPEDGYFCTGIHPWSLEKNQNLKADLLLNHLSDRCLAIGECGLDRVRGDFELQRNLFLAHIELAEKSSIDVLIVHCVKAYSDLIQIVKETGYTGKVVIHDYNGNEETTNQLLNHHFYFSFGDKLFRPESKGFKTFESVALDRLFLETDDGKRGDIVSVYSKASEIRGLSVAELEQAIELNWKNLFPNAKWESRGRSPA